MTNMSPLKSIYVPNWVTLSQTQLKALDGVDRLLYAFSGWAEDGSLSSGTSVDAIKAFVASVQGAGLAKYVPCVDSQQ